MKYAPTWSQSTRRMYLAHWASFTQWCDDNNQNPLPASSTCLSDYIDAQMKPRPPYSTLRMRIIAIGQVHEAHDLENPTHTPFISEKMFHVRMELGDDRPNAKTPATPDVVCKMVAALDPRDLKNLRDRSILLLGAATGLGRAELVTLDYEDLKWHPDGVLIKPFRLILEQQEDEAICPVDAVNSWCDSAGIVKGPLFRAMDRYRNVRNQRLCPKTISRVVKAAAEAAGLSPNVYSSSSLSL